MLIIIGLGGAGLNEAVNALQALKACTWCLPRLPRENSFMVPVRIVSSSFSFYLFFPLVCSGLHICLAFWVKQENNLLYILNGLNTLTQTHTCVCVCVCVCSLIVLTALVACAWLALWHSFLLLSLHLSSAAAAHTVPVRSSRTPWPWLRGDLCKFVRRNTHFFSNCQKANQIFGWSKFPAARQGRQASYLRTNKHRNKLHISNGRRVFAPL